MTSDTLSFEEGGLAQDFLMEAFNSLLATGDAKRLGITGEKPKGETDYDKAVSAFSARQRVLAKRMEFARSAVLWTALGVEAAANYYIAATLPEDAEALDDLKTVNKLLVAPQLATGEALFRTDAEPIGQIRTLFKLRNRVVHPKVGKQAIVGKPGIADFTPRAAGDCLIAAARAVAILGAALPEGGTFRAWGADLILKRESDLREFARQWTDGLPKPRPAPRYLRLPLVKREVTTPEPTEPTEPEAGEDTDLPPPAAT